MINYGLQIGNLSRILSQLKAINHFLNVARIKNAKLAIHLFTIQLTCHSTSLSICSGETADDFAFVFRSVKVMIDKLFFMSVPTYSPQILIADGAEAITNGFIAIFVLYIRIMCWAHVVRAVDKRLNVTALKDYKNEIMGDIYALQLSFSPLNFKYSSDLFLMKWKLKNLPAVNEMDEF